MKTKRKPASDLDKAMAKVGSSSAPIPKANKNVAAKVKENNGKPINYENKPHIL